MIVVRRATEMDLPQYLVHAKDFHRASPIYDVLDFSDEGFSQFYLASLANNDVGIWLAEKDGEVVGVTGAVVYPMYFNANALVAQELWWWLTPRARGSGAAAKMYHEIEQWAQAKGADAMFMIALEDDHAEKMENLYRRGGFKPMERTFIKKV